MASETSTPRPDDGWSLKTKLIVGAVGLTALALTYLFSVTIWPRWWAQRVGDVVDGRMSVGWLFGITIGVVFTVLPISALLIAWRLRSGLGRWALSLAVAALLAAPNLTTIGIMAGNGGSAHSAERVLDNDGPGFRLGSMMGMAIGAVLVLGVRWLAWSRKRHKRARFEAARNDAD